MSHEQRSRDITNPHQNDVLSGRGNNVNLHPGNKNYRSVVLKFKNEYIAAPKSKKPQFARMVVETIRNLDPPGRFLKQDANTQLWSDIGDKKAMDKARQALREGAPEIIQQIGVLERASSDGTISFDTTLFSVPNVRIENASQTQQDSAPHKVKISPKEENIDDEHTAVSGIGLDLGKFRSPSLRDSLESFPGHKGKISPVEENIGDEHAAVSGTELDWGKFRSLSLQDSLESFPGHESQLKSVPLRDSFYGPSASSFTEVTQSSKEDMRNSLYTDELFEKESVPRSRQRSSILSDNTARLLQKMYGPDLVNLPLGRRDSALIREIYQSSLSDATLFTSSFRTNSIGKDFQHSPTDLMHETDFDVSMESVSSNAIHQFVEQLVNREREKIRDNLENPSLLTDDEFKSSNMSFVTQDMVGLNSDEPKI